MSCLYVNKLEDIDLEVLENMLKKSWKLYSTEKLKIETVEEYINNVPENAKEKFMELREYVKSLIPNNNEVLSYGIIGYKVAKKGRGFTSLHLKTIWESIPCLRTRKYYQR